MNKENRISLMGIILVNFNILYTDFKPLINVEFYEDRLYLYHSKALPIEDLEHFIVKE